MSKELAEEGKEFIQGEKLENCVGCEYEKVCIDNLEPGRRYKIIKVRDVEHHCPIHKGPIKVVEVTEPPIIALLNPKKAMVGSKITYEPINKECEEHKDLLKPEGLRKGDQCKVLNHGERITCQGENLIKVKLRRIP